MHLDVSAGFAQRTAYAGSLSTSLSTWNNDVHIRNWLFGQQTLLFKQL
jgi:hypothetical protein